MAGMSVGIEPAAVVPSATQAVQPTPRAHNAWLDRFGAFLGIACAVHCVVVPLMLGVLPSLGLEFLADEGVDHTIVLIASGCAALAAWFGWRAHRDIRIVLGFAASVGMLVLAHEVGEGQVLGRAISVAGGIGLAATHFWNTRRSRACKTPGHVH